MSTLIKFVRNARQFKIIFLGEHDFMKFVPLLQISMKNILIKNLKKTDWYK